MKVLILTASIGAGHVKAAEALKNFLPEVEVIDFMARDFSTLNWLTKKIYLAALKFIPDLYDKLYRLTDAQRTGTLTRFLTSIFMYFPFVRLLKKFRPNVIICTHPFPESAAALWKFLHAKSAKNFLLAAVLTDYSLHEIWIFSEVDVYFVATEKMKIELAAHSRQNQEIFAKGIPIGAEFSNAQNSTRAGFKKILIMGGGLGLGSIEETLQDLNNIETPLEIIVVAGQNENLLARLKILQPKLKHSTKILGYVKNICELMNAADLLITKPGALTMTEAFAAGLPMLLNSPIPGPEVKNAEYAISNGAAISVGEKKVSAVVNELFKNPARILEMKLHAKKLSKVDAAAGIAKIIINKFKS